MDNSYEPLYILRRQSCAKIPIRYYNSIHVLLIIILLLSQNSFGFLRGEHSPEKFLRLIKSDRIDPQLSIFVWKHSNTFSGD